MTYVYQLYKDKSQEEINESFIDACMSGDIDIVRYLLNSNDLKINAQINAKDSDALFFATVNNQVKVVKYLITSPELKEKSQISKNVFITACAEGRLELIKFFLTSPQIIKRPILSENEDDALHYACKNSRFEVVKYFLTTDDLWRKANPDLAFRKSYEAGNLEMVKFLILDIGIKYSPYIRLYMGRNPNQSIESWFEKSELNKELKNDLSVNPNIVKKVKL